MTAMRMCSRQTFGGKLPRTLAGPWYMVCIRMSLFESYAYRRKGDVMVLTGNSEKENRQKTDDGNTKLITPNKAHQSDFTTEVPDTPDSLLPTPPRDKKSQERQKQRRRRRARILSSSEEEVETPNSPCSSTDTPGKSNGLFSGLPVSKRCKKGIGGFRDGKERPAMPRLWQLGCQSVSNSNSKLFHGRNGDEDGGRGMGRELSSRHRTGHCDPITAASPVQPRRGIKLSYLFICRHNNMPYYLCYR